MRKLVNPRHDDIHENLPARRRMNAYGTESAPVKAKKREIYTVAEPRHKRRARADARALNFNKMHYQIDGGSPNACSYALASAGCSMAPSAVVSNAPDATSPSAAGASADVAPSSAFFLGLAPRGLLTSASGPSFLY